MTCSSCVSHVQKAAEKVDGVLSVNVNLLTNSMQLEYDEEKTNDAAIIKAIQNAGYDASIDNPSAANAPSAQNSQSGQKSTEDEYQSTRRRIYISFGILLPLMYISMGHMLHLPLPAILHGAENALILAFTQLLLSLIIVYVNRVYYERGFKSLFRAQPNMDSLIAIGSAAAMIYGIFVIYKIGFALGRGDLDTAGTLSMDLYFESAAMILTLITLGKHLEARSKAKTTDAISKLVSLAPDTVHVIRGGVEQQIPTSEIVQGDLLVVRPGERIAVDGIVTEGNSSLDMSALTGESIPQEITVGSKVASASVNKNGSFTFTATRVGSDTTLSQIIRLVEEASASKAPIAKLADKISAIFVPSVIAVAAVTLIVWLFVGQSFDFALSRAISVLVISCPCALGLATPVAIMVGTGKGAEHGILIKSAEALETAHAVNAVVLDKTGTITNGTPIVTDVITYGISERELLTLAASIEKPSEHPLAEAILHRAETEQLPLSAVTDFAAISGRGVLGKINEDMITAGNAALMNEKNIALGDAAKTSEQLAQNGRTPLFFAKNDVLIGIIAVSDTPKPSSAQAVSRFEELGISVYMLTGDNARTAAAIAKQVGIHNVISDVMPNDKEARVRELMEAGNITAMIGDGINDSPALARSDVGIAIGAGTDIAIESADIVLMNSDLNDAATAVELSRAVIANIKMSLFWAFFYNTVGIPLAAGLLYPAFHITLSPMIGAAAMSLSSVSVVTNALRLRAFKPKTIEEACPIGVENDADITIKEAEAISAQKGSTMKKEIKVEGMSCNHCKMSVEKALKAIDGVESAIVDLDAKNAVVELSRDVADDVLSNAISAIDFKPMGVRTL